MRHTTRFVAFCVLALGIAAAASAPSNAGLLPVKVTVTPDSGNYRWTYNVVLTSDSQLTSGDFFTIYDFDGIISGSATSSDPNFTFSSNLVGNTPTGTAPFDDPSKFNLTWTYNGPTLTGQTSIGNFSVISMFDDMTDGAFSGRSLRTVDGKVDRNVTDTTVATGTPVVPEPATIALVAMGLPILGARRLIRRKA